MRISDWSSDVCSSDLLRHAAQRIAVLRLVFLAATEWPKTLIEAYAAMALAQRYPVPADVNTQIARLGLLPGIGQPRLETRPQVIGNIQQGRANQQADRTSVA